MVDQWGKKNIKAWEKRGKKIKCDTKKKEKIEWGRKRIDII